MTDSGVAARFWAQVQRGTPDECWPWTGAPGTHGYGVFHPTKRGTVRANRMALELHLGRPLTGWALHACDNPPCCNPNPGHLYEGDHAQNVADRDGRERQSRGEHRPGAKLTVDLVRELRERAASGLPLAELADAYGVALSNITMIVRGQRWKHAGGPITQRYDTKARTA